MRVAVLGAGPAGLMAAEGARLAGAAVDVYAEGKRSDLFGAQYLHAPIPGVTARPPVRVEYRLTGDIIGYRNKVYDEAYDGVVSPEDYNEPHDAWDIRQTYDELWSRWGHRLFPMTVAPEHIAQMLNEYLLVISSIPAPAICITGVHTFRSVKVWACGDAPERNQRIPFAHDVPPNTVLCSGKLDHEWYRISNIYGFRTMEWPWRDGARPHPLAAPVTKPLDHDCDCWPRDLVARVGRYGRWHKGVLSDSAFRDARDAVTALESVA